MSKTWLDKEDKLCRDMAKKGLTPAEMSKVLISRKPGAIKCYCYAHGIKITASTPQIDMKEFNRLMKEK